MDIRLSISKPTWLSFGSPKSESRRVSNSMATNLFLVNWDLFTRPKYPPGLPRVWLSGERKKANPSPNEFGLTLVMEKENLVEKEAVVFDSGSKKVMGLL